MSTETRGVRDESVDAARGVAIVLIVLSHVERGLATASLMPADTAEALDRLLYLAHIVAFAYLAGLFVRRGVERDGPRTAVARRTTLLVWLYLLWTVIQGSVRVAASSVSNTAVTVGDVVRVWIPEGQLWFLPWLVAVTVVAALSRPWVSRSRMIGVLGATAALAVAVWGYEPLYVFTRGWALLLPFLVGCVVTHSRHAALARRTLPVVVAAVVGTAVWLWIGLGTDATPPTNDGDGRSLETVALGLVGSAAGTAAILAIAGLLAVSPAARVVSVIGRRSLEIFLAHIVVTAGTRIVLVQVHVTDTWIHVVAGTSLGLVLPIGVAVLAERLGWSWLFGLPKRARG